MHASNAYDEPFFRCFFLNVFDLFSSGVLCAVGGNAVRADGRGRLLGGAEATVLEFPFLVFLRVAKVYLFSII